MNNWNELEETLSPIWGRWMATMIVGCDGHVTLLSLDKGIPGDADWIGVHENDDEFDNITVCEDECYGTVLAKLMVARALELDDAK